jgi:hypothetical protein
VVVGEVLEGDRGGIGKNRYEASQCQDLDFTCFDVLLDGMNEVDAMVV